MKKTKPYNVILADCAPSEVQSFADSVSEIINEPFVIESSFKKKISKNTLKGKVLYYGSFFTFAFKAWRKRHNYRIVLAWQQFYANNFAFYSRLFGSRNSNITLVSVNYTYKEKHGLIGRIYKRYMKYCTDNRYIDFFHVLSNNYAQSVSDQLGIHSDRFIVTHFGTPDNAEEWRQLPSPNSTPYILSIGRSNRDFDFLCDVWRQPELKDFKLIILADAWNPGYKLPENVEHHTDIIGHEAFPYIANAALSVIPIENPNICSGDTVLLNSMMMSIPVAVTSPSTLSEMYITDNVDGIYLPRDVERAARRLSALLKDRDRLKELGENARKTYISSFSRNAMGRTLAQKLMNKKRE
ncbi:MAG: glycosyltransferase family 4 protein [Bacteroides sp.]|nr:glycosyltransferase family 4 protein [Bacteroides sp.]